MRIIEKKKCKIKKLGNSKGLILDKDTLEYLDLNVGDWVIVDIKKDLSKKNNNKD